ncbi:MAG TPA: thiol-disulfide oxidoreductase, partial [Methylocystis sp.]
GEAWLAALFGAPGAIWFTRLVYDRFADLLWAWNKRAGRW